MNTIFVVLALLFLGTGEIGPIPLPEGSTTLAHADDGSQSSIARSREGIAEPAPAPPVIAPPAPPVVGDTTQTETVAINGQFPGYFATQQANVPITTEFLTAPDGQVSGRYSYDDGGVPTVGLLTDCTLDQFVLSCVWRDKYGAGEFVVAFAPDLRSFDGSWYDASLPLPHNAPFGGYRWVGQRANF